MASKFHVDQDIRTAETLNREFYTSEELFEQQREKIFYHSWNWVGDKGLIPLTGSVHPFVLYPGFMEEPLLLSRDASDDLKCLSNVCTHRANIVINNPGKMLELRCEYHGRRFEMDGKFKSMPEFKEAENFPRECEGLRNFPLVNWRDFLFTSLDPKVNFDTVLAFMDERIGFLDFEELQARPDLSKDYLVNAHWALYCDNYLEGFHIPFVHNDLNDVLDYGSYETVLSDFANLQIGYSKGGDEVFDLPKDHVDAGKYVSAYYFWVFPNMMFNFYPWGLSVNVVKPISVGKTKVSFITYVSDESKLEKGAGALLDKVEREDEFVVEGVYKGMQSRFYPGGRYSPKRETGVHHFHRLLAEFMS